MLCRELILVHEARVGSGSMQLGRSEEELALKSQKVVRGVTLDVWQRLETVCVFRELVMQGPVSGVDVETNIFCDSCCRPPTPLGPEDPYDWTLFLHPLPLTHTMPCSIQGG